VRRAIEVLGHRIDVSSVASRGSRFSTFAARTDQMSDIIASEQKHGAWEMTI
jgi:hypothetical protein